MSATLYYSSLGNLWISLINNCDRTYIATAEAKKRSRIHYPYILVGWFFNYHVCDRTMHITISQFTILDTKLTDAIGDGQ
ncbi:MAG: hypothetical protein WBB28_06300 [Crinalium sp.]